MARPIATAKPKKAKKPIESVIIVTNTLLATIQNQAAAQVRSQTDFA